MILNKYRILLSALELVKSMNGLASNCNAAVHTGNFEALADSYRPLIEKLPLDGGIEPLVNSLSWAIYTAQSEASNGMSLLTQLANRFVRECDSIIMEPSSDFILYIFISTDNPLDYLAKLNRRQRLELARRIGWYFDDVEYDGTERETDDFDIYVDEMCTKFVEEKSYQKIIEEMHQSVGFHHRTIESLIRFIINLIQGEDRRLLVKTINRTRIVLEMTKEEDSLLDELVDEFGDSLTRTELGWLQTSISTNFKVFIESTRGCEEIKLPCIEVGTFIWNFDSDMINLAMAMGEDGRLVQDVIERTMVLTIEHLLKYYHGTDNAELALQNLVSSYITNKGDSGWFSGDYLKSVKLYLLQDQAFQMFCEDNPDCSTKLKLDADEDAFRNLIYRFNGLTIEDGPIATESIGGEKRLIRKERELEERERALEERERQLNETPKRTKKKDLDEEDAEDDDDQEETPDYEIDARQSTKGYRKSSTSVSDASRKIYNAYHKFKRNESAVDSQINKMVSDAKTAFGGGDKTEAILSGKRWTPMGLLKQALRTAAIFSFSKIGGLIYLVSTVALDKKRTNRQRRAILGELDTEIRLIEEKIEDARGDGNRQAKYALMRTKGELERARDKIQYNLAASTRDLETAKNLIRGKRYGDIER